MIETHAIDVASTGNGQVIDLTEELEECLSRGKIAQGIVTIFVVGSTAAISTTEFEPGLVNQDLRAGAERLAPENGEYLHEKTWNDDNGHSHVRATFVGPSLTVPLVAGRLTLGTWQQVILIDYDTRPRERRIVVQAMGE